jgi:hypothetical protein
MPFMGSPPVLPPANQNDAGGVAEAAQGASVSRDVFPYCFNVDEALCSFLKSVPLIGSAGEAGCRAIANAICLILGIAILVVLLIVAFNALAT